jgi:hypothetical protein
MSNKSNLKNINLNDLVKSAKKDDLINQAWLSPARPSFEAEVAAPTYERKMALKKSSRDMVGEYSLNSQQHMLDNYKMNYYSNKTKINWLDYLNNINKVKDKSLAEYIDKQIEWEKCLEPEEFVPTPKQPGEIIPLTFRKFFFSAIPGDITQIALKNPKKLQGLIEEAQTKIQREALVFTDFIFAQQVSTALGQAENYSSNAKTYQEVTEFQKVEAVIQQIIDTNLKMRYESSQWNKEGRKTSSQVKDLLLICDASLYRQIEISRHKEYFIEEKEDYKGIRKLPLPLNEVWNHFREVITIPLKNNFKFVIIDKRALVSWHELEQLEVKYDETNSLTYFLRKVHGGFKFLTHYNACVFISK